VKIRSWIGRTTFRAVGVVIALTVTLLAAGRPSVAHAMPGSAMHGGESHHGGFGEHPGHADRGHDGGRDHYWPHHFYGRPNGIYYVYPYNHYSYRWIYPYYPAPTYQAPTYWYYCSSYGAYYPYVASCPEAWVSVPAS